VIVPRRESLLTRYPELVDLLGTVVDGELAKRYGVQQATICSYRHRLQIRPYTSGAQSLERITSHPLVICRKPLEVSGRIYHVGEEFPWSSIPGVSPQGVKKLFDEGRLNYAPEVADRYGAFAGHRETVASSVTAERERSQNARIRVLEGVLADERAAKLKRHAEWQELCRTTKAIRDERDSLRDQLDAAHATINQLQAEIANLLMRKSA
jgi:hypothetical protein